MNHGWKGMERTHYVVHGLLDEQMFALATLDLRLLGAYLWLNMLNMLNHMAFSVIGPVCRLQ